MDRLRPTHRHLGDRATRRRHRYRRARGVVRRSGRCWGHEGSSVKVQAKLRTVHCVVYARTFIDLLPRVPRFYVTRSHIPFSGGTALYVTRSHIPFSGGTALCVTRSHIPFSWGYRVKVEEEEEEVRQGRGRGGGGRCVVIWPLPARYRSFETQQRTRAK